MFGGHQAFFTIFNPKNVWSLPSIFYQFQSQKCMAITMHFLPFSIQKMFGSRKVFSRISCPKNAWGLQGVFYHF
jgi:hypothetical protein